MSKRPTSRTANAQISEWGRKHLHLWIGRGPVCLQVQARVWRLTVGVTFWKAYEP